MKKIAIPFLFLFCCFISSTCFSSPLSISDGVFSSNSSSHSFYSSFGRALLQAKKPCPVDFNTKNYSIITSQCKGPNYPAQICCEAYKTFACPYIDYLNDVTNDCATIMFRYLHNDYKSGFFIEKCKECQLGVDCDGYLAPAPAIGRNNVDNDSNNNRNPSMLLTLINYGIYNLLIRIHSQVYI